MDDILLRSLTPSVLAVLGRRGAGFAAAEDAVQDALVEAVRTWPADPPRDPKGWLVTVAWRRFLDATRADAARRRREDLVDEEPVPGPAPAVDDTLQLYFLCAHPSLTPSSAVALTLRAVGGLTTRQIARAYLVPEATMGQRISRAKRTVSGVRFDRPGDVATVLRVLYLVFNEGYSGDVDLAAEAIRLTRRLAAQVPHPEVAGLLALMLLHHARRAARTGPDGQLVPLAEQDRSRWDTAVIAEGVGILRRALARDRLGEFQAQAAVAALHADAPRAEETDWVQIVEWYDELVRLTDSPVVRLNRAVAVGEADGPRAGLTALAALDDSLPRHTAVAAWLHERDGDLVTAARLYAEAARKAPNLAERDHLTRRAARLHQQENENERHGPERHPHDRHRNN
ncbi:RNA polymerase sigma factor [Streptomyces ziwulingensis]|uniref:RNA polymerase sigma factor n=1 Tax=Streptomyces ziwulingensis TaxID=1045501 RepID=A0ABP9BXF7_9ACTN